MRKITILLGLLLMSSLGVSNLFAQGEAAVPFLLIAPGARNGGMGEAGVALANDANAVYWNPAGLAFQYDDPERDKKNEISLMHSKWLPQFNFSDLFYEFMAARFYIEGIGMVGGSFTFLNLGKNVWTDENGNELGTFDSNEFAIALSYSTKIQENMGIGVNLKYIRSNLSNVSVGSENRDGRAHTLAVDIGYLWKPAYDIFNNRFSFGANLSNFGPKITYIDQAQADPLPTNLRLGIAYDVIDDGFNKLTFVYDTNRLLVVKDTSGTSDNVFKAVFYSAWAEGDLAAFTHSLGLEYRYGTLIALRTGYFYEDPSHGARKFFTFGAGLEYSIFGIDFSYLYTWEDEDHPLSDTVRFSLAVKF